MKNTTANFEVYGAKLQLAREAQGLSKKQLGLKVCLSKEHIAQLENNQSEIFFTAAHKIQVAKKVGSALGLNESEYLMYQEDEISNSTVSIMKDPITSIPLPISTDLFTKANVKPMKGKKSLFIPATLILSSIGIIIGITALSNDLMSINLMQLIEKPTPTQAVNNQVVEETPIESNSAELPNPAITEEPEIKKLVANNESTTCAPQNQGTLQEPEIYRTVNPSKSGEMVYLLSREHQTVCVMDSQNKSFPLDLDAGQSRSIYGKAPFTVFSTDLNKFDIYFQGWKVKIQNTGTKALRLEATELAQN